MANVSLVCRHCSFRRETLPSEWPNGTDPVGTVRVVSCCPACYRARYLESGARPAAGLEARREPRVVIEYLSIVNVVLRRDA